MVRVFAPFTPFLTEHMYQNLRHLVDGEVQESVHYLMIPDARKDLIDVHMERAVARYVPAGDVCLPEVRERNYSTEQ
jgi:isoleucyl-tRNA synthetase